MLQRDPALAGVGLVVFDEFHERHLECRPRVGAVPGPPGRAQPRAAAAGDVGHPRGRGGGRPARGCPGRPLRGPPVSGRDALPGSSGRGAAGRRRGAGGVGRRALRDRQHPRVPPGRAGDPPHLRAAVRRSARTGVDRRPALREPIQGRAGPRDRARAARPAQGRPGHQHRRDQPHDRRHPRRGGRRAGARAAFRRAQRHDPAGDAAGVAGRCRPAPRPGRPDGTGVCYRLWDESEHVGLRPFDPPEILQADMAGLVLECAIWGVDDPGRLRWLDPPPAAACRQAGELLGGLAALDGQRPGDRARPPHGRAPAAPAPGPHGAPGPRAGDGAGGLRPRGRPERARFHRVPARAGRLGPEAAPGGDGGRALRPLAGGRRHPHRPVRLPPRRAGRGRARPLRAAGRPSAADDVGRALSWAYPDRIGLRRPGEPGRYLLCQRPGRLFRGSRTAVLVRMRGGGPPGRRPPRSAHFSRRRLRPGLPARGFQRRAAARGDRRAGTGAAARSWRSARCGWGP